MHGAGNDYIYVNTLACNLPNPNALAVEWSKPHTGIGSDGLVLIGKPSLPEADFSMRIFNADGSEAMMCGNASRCIGKYLYEKGLVNSDVVRLETLSGIKTLQLHLSANKQTVESVTVDMLEPAFHNPAQFIGKIERGEQQVEVNGRALKGVFVSMGNPHFVVFVDDLANISVAGDGQIMEHLGLFPQRCNIEFAQIIGDGIIKTRVWERGSGITMACGTGACATAVAAALTNRSGRQSAIVMDGGTLHIEWRADNHVYMTGPAAFSFEGTITINDTI